MADSGTCPVMQTKGMSSKHGVAQRGDNVGGRRAARHHGHPGPAGGVGVALGHVAGPLLVADQDVADGRLQEGVVDGQDGPAGEAEHDLRPFHLQALDERLGASDLRGPDPFGGLRSHGKEKPPAPAEGRRAQRGGTPRCARGHQNEGGGQPVQSTPRGARCRNRRGRVVRYPGFQFLDVRVGDGPWRWRGGLRFGRFCPRAEASPTTSGGPGTAASPSCSGSTPPSFPSSPWPGDFRPSTPSSKGPSSR